MPLNRLHQPLKKQLSQFAEEGRLKGQERVIVKVTKQEQGFRYHIKGYPGREFIKMNSNSYLGLSLSRELIDSEHHASTEFGVGPGAVRFIDGTFQTHKALEIALADFHGREACQIFSSAYAAVCGVIAPLVNEKCWVLSDELNHNCIINSLRLAKVAKERKIIYPHLDYEKLRSGLKQCSKLETCDRVIIATDGVFSMRGDFADLAKIQALAEEFNDSFNEGVVTIVDDSHGVGAYGKTGRGTCEVTGSQPDILVATLGKAMGVNGGYVCSSSEVIDYLRETSPFYVYSNPITPGEAAAALRAIKILDSTRGEKLLKDLRENAEFFKAGLKALGFKLIETPHPIVAVQIGDTQKTRELIKTLFEHNILAVGLGYPVVPHGQETIRFQISAIHTQPELSYVLDVLKKHRHILDVG